jgi:hypothetical protein
MVGASMVALQALARNAILICVAAAEVSIRGNPTLELTVRAIGRLP